ncbi:MAG: cation:proton antiporter [Methyloligellaceae bacterium]
MDTIGFTVIATGVIFFALVSKRLENTIITPPMVFAVFGLIIGEAVLGLADLDFGHGFTHGLAELTLILVLFSDAARIDLSLLRRDHNLPVRMLLVGMPLTIVAGALVALALPLGLSLWEAALLATILAPTDAALGQAVVSSPLVPARIRQALNVESGLNDGIALPLVLLFASLAGMAHTGEGGQNWALFGAKQIMLGPLAGMIIGGAGAWLLDTAVKKEWITESYEGAAVLGIALLAYSGAEIIEGNGFIAAFVSGLVFGNFVRGRCGFVFEFAEAEGQLLVLLTFLIFCAAILPHSFGDIDWVIALYAVLSLTVIRMLPIAVSLIGSGVRAPTTAFLGWFGPRGLASLLFALFVLEDIPTGAGTTLLVITVVTVFLSILAHGLSAAPLARRYADLAARMGQCEETKAVSEMPTRVRMNARARVSRPSKD